VHMVFKYVKGPLALHVFQLSFERELTCNNKHNMGPHGAAVV